MTRVIAITLEDEDESRETDGDTRERCKWSESRQSTDVYVSSVSRYSEDEGTKRLQTRHDDAGRGGGQSRRTELNRAHCAEELDDDEVDN